MCIIVENIDLLALHNTQKSGFIYNYRNVLRVYVVLEDIPLNITRDTQQHSLDPFNLTSKVL